MGGRGTYAVGKNVGYTYKTVGEIEGVKVLRPMYSKKSFSMPLPGVEYRQPARTITPQEYEKYKRLFKGVK